MVHEALNKRIPYLDAFGKGLEVVGMKSSISHFPELLKPMFVSSNELNASDVLRLLKPHPSFDMTDDQLKVWKYFLAFLDQADATGKSICVHVAMFFIISMFISLELHTFLQYVTGCSAAVDPIHIMFTSSSDAISASTCSRQISLSTAISCEDIFIAAMKVVIQDVSFTTP